jgi:hypothetical protein
MAATKPARAHPRTRRSRLQRLAHHGAVRGSRPTRGATAWAPSAPSCCCRSSSTRSPQVYALKSKAGTADAASSTPPSMPCRPTCRESSMTQGMSEPCAWRAPTARLPAPRHCAGRRTARARGNRPFGAVVVAAGGRRCWPKAYCNNHASHRRLHGPCRDERRARCASPARGPRPAGKSHDLRVGRALRDVRRRHLLVAASGAWCSASTR